jgi:predicted ABC-type ATPase
MSSRLLSKEKGKKKLRKPTNSCLTGGHILQLAIVLIQTPALCETGIRILQLRVVCGGHAVPSDDAFQHSTGDSLPQFLVSVTLTSWYFILGDVPQLNHE